MADNTLNISPPFKFEVKTAPRGMTDYDPSAIDEQQQEQLNAYKLDLMRENISYISKHPEVKAIYSWTGRYFYTVKPKEIFERFGAKYSITEVTLRQEIKKLMNEELYEIEHDLAESEGEDWDY